MRARKRSLLFPLFAAVGVVLATGAVAWACTSDSWIRIDPTSGIPGATVQVDGGSFVNGQVHLYWDSVTSSSHLKSVDTDQVSEGEESPGASGFSTTVTIPEDAQPGEHAIVARSDPDDEGTRYNSAEAFEVVEDDSPSEPSEDGSNDASGDSSPQSSGDPSPETSGDSSEETSSSPSQSTSGTTSQEASGQTGQESSGEASQPNAIPPSQRQPERPRDPAQADDTGTSPDGAAQTPDADADPGAGEPATSGSDPAADQGEPETPSQAPDRQTVGEAPSRQEDPNRQTVGDDSTPAPSPEPAPSVAQTPDDEAGSAAAATPDASEQSAEPPVTDDSVGAGEEQDRQPAEAEEPVAADSERTAGFSVPEAMRIGPDGSTAQTPSTGSASGDLWSGLQAGDTPSLTPDAAVDDESANEGMSGALTAGVAMLALGSILLLGGVGATAARRRRQPATAATRSRERRRSS